MLKVSCACVANTHQSWYCRFPAAPKRKISYYYDTDSKQGLLIKEQVPMGISRIQGMGARRGVQPGVVAPPGIWKWWRRVIPKIFARALGARIKCSKIYSKTSTKHSRKCSLVPSARWKACHFRQSMRSGKICTNFRFVNFGAQNNK